VRKMLPMPICSPWSMGGGIKEGGDRARKLAGDGESGESRHLVLRHRPFHIQEKKGTDQMGRGRAEGGTPRPGGE